MIAEIYIYLKKTVSDPQGLAVKHALEALGYNELTDVRIGKLVRLSLNLKGKTGGKLRARHMVEQMCKKLLANPIIEDYSFKIKEG